MKDQWIKVKDSLPLVSGYILVVNGYDGLPWVAMYYSEVKTISTDEDCIDINMVTHWQPIVHPVK